MKWKNQPTFRMRLLPATLALVFLSLSNSSAVFGASYILPVDAIEASRHLSADEFRRQFPGIKLDGGHMGDFGYYVRYHHENLYYFFGPIEQLPRAQDAMGRLEDIVSSAMVQRNRLSTSEIDIIRFDRNGVRNLGDGTEGAERSTTAGDELVLGGMGQDDRRRAAQRGDREGQRMDSGEMNGSEGQDRELQQMGQEGQPGDERSQQRSQQQRQQQGQQGQPSRQQGQDGSPDSPPIPMDSGEGGPPMNIWEMLRRIFGGR